LSGASVFRWFEEKLAVIITKLAIIAHQCKKAVNQVRIDEILNKRRKQLRYRANHRGIKEMDIILGKFADGFIGEFDNLQLDNFEALMENNDRDLLQWFTGELSPPDEINQPLFQQILEFTKTRYSEK